jgi:hydroxymethylpyrimidine/phosphomethylpyrimidine kinase
MKYFALTIAGSDSGGGAGIQADLRTFASLGVHGLCAVTAVTAQNSQGVLGVERLSAGIVSAQIKAVMEDIGCGAAKTGMLFDAGMIRQVARDVKRFNIKPLVVDPVMVAKGGHPLLKRSAERALIRELLPLAAVVTPNMDEASRLAGMPVRTIGEMREAARRIHSMGPSHVLVKGGHLGGAAADVLFDGRRFVELRSSRVRTRHTHGTGCTLSAAMAAYLARGRGIGEAVRGAKRYVTGAIGRSYRTGRGTGSLDHFWRMVNSRPE